MKFNLDGKDYNSDDLSDKGKACLNKLTRPWNFKKQQLSLRDLLIMKYSKNIIQSY
jgi:hypothetical protein